MSKVHSKTARLPISRKPDIGFLRELDTFKKHSMKMLQTEYQVPQRLGTNLKIRLKLLHMTLDSLL